MKKLLSYDKCLHFIVGVLLASVLVHFLSPLSVLLVSLLIGVSKEVIWDMMMKRGSLEIMDVVYQIAGTLLILLINITN